MSLNELVEKYELVCPKGFKHSQLNWMNSNLIDYPYVFIGPRFFHDRFLKANIFNVLFTYC